MSGERAERARGAEQSEEEEEERVKGSRAPQGERLGESRSEGGVGPLSSACGKPERDQYRRPFPAHPAPRRDMFEQRIHGKKNLDFYVLQMRLSATLSNVKPTNK
jgi:hypothetical protein